LQAQSGSVAGALVTMRAAAEEGRDLADALGDRSHAQLFRVSLGWAQLFQGELAAAVAQFAALVAETRAAHGDDPYGKAASLACLGIALAYRGDTGAARAAAHEAFEAAA
jgi:hypothetical protein